jgi:hypothetical protein
VGRNGLCDDVGLCLVHQCVLDNFSLLEQHYRGLV